jgi:hypothetical protein
VTPDLCAHAHHMRLCFRVFYIIKASHMVVLQRAGKELGPSPRVASHSMKAAVRRPGFIYFKRTAMATAYGSLPKAKLSIARRA